MKKFILLVLIISPLAHAVKMLEVEEEGIQDYARNPRNYKDRYQQPQVLPAERVNSKKTYDEPQVLPGESVVTKKADLPQVLPGEPKSKTDQPQVLPAAPVPLASLGYRVDPQYLNSAAALSYSFLNQRYDYEGRPDVSVTGTPPDVAAIYAKYPGLSFEQVYFMKRAAEEAFNIHDQKARCEVGELQCAAVIASLQLNYAKNLYDPNNKDSLCGSQKSEKEIKACISFGDEVIKAFVNKLDGESQVKELLAITYKTTYANGYSEDNFSGRYTEELAMLIKQRDQVNISQTCVGNEAITVGGFIDAGIIEKRIAQLKAKAVTEGWSVSADIAPASQAQLNCQGSAAVADNTSSTNGTAANSHEGSVRDIVQLANVAATMDTMERYNCSGPVKPAQCATYEAYDKQVIPSTLDALCRTSACRTSYTNYYDAALQVADSKVSPAVATAMAATPLKTAINPISASNMLSLVRFYQQSVEGLNVSNNSTSKVSAVSATAWAEQIKSSSAAFYEQKICPTADESCRKLASTLSTAALNIKSSNNAFIPGVEKKKTTAAAQSSSIASSTSPSLSGPDSSSQSSFFSEGEGSVSLPAQVNAAAATQKSPSTHSQNAISATSAVGGVGSKSNLNAYPTQNNYHSSQSHASPSASTTKDALNEADQEVVMANYERTKGDYKSDEEDVLFQKVSKAYVRNLEKVLKKKKLETQE